MKKILVSCALGLGAVLSAHAGPSSFVKVGNRYEVRVGTEQTELAVRADDGDGWFFCEVVGLGITLHCNFNQATSIRFVTGVVGEVLPPAQREIKMKVLLQLKRLEIAAAVFMVEHDTAEARLSDLVGPDRAVKELVPVDGEDYATVVFRRGMALVVRTKSGLEVRYEP